MSQSYCQFADYGRVLANGGVHLNRLASTLRLGGARHIEDLGELFGDFAGVHGKHVPDLSRKAWQHFIYTPALTYLVLEAVFATKRDDIMTVKLFVSSGS